MAKTVAKKPLTREQYETALQNYVQSHNLYAKLAAKRDEQVRKVDAIYEAQFADLKESMEGCFESVQQYCEANREELFPEIKSLDAFGATVGFREGKEKVSIMKGFKEKDIVAKLQRLESWEPYIRLTPALDKTSLIANKPKGMEKYGLQVVQEESFYLEVEQTEVDA